MVEDSLGVEHTYDTMMDGNVDDSQKIRNPILVQSQERKHDKEMKVELDVSAREMH